MRSVTEDNLNVLGTSTEFRLDVVVQPAARLRALRVTGPVVVVGGGAEAARRAGGRSIRWPLCGS
jgi:hypothetical protein